MRTKNSIIILLISFGYGSAFSQGMWSEDSSTGFIARRNFTSAVVDNKIYVIRGAATLPLQIFDPSAHQWSTPSVTNDSDGYGTASVVINRKIYVIGGSLFTANTDINVFDPTTNSWSTPTTTGQFTYRGDCTSSAVNDKIYVIGGDTGNSSPVNIVEVFDPATNTWTTPLTTGKFTPRSGLTSSVVNGKIYVIGGDTDIVGSSCDLLEVFDPVTNTWSTPNVSGSFIRRSYHTASALNNKIYVIGGGSKAFPFSHFWGDSDTIELQEFDVSTNTWSTPRTSGTFTSRTDLSSNVVNGKIYVLGGYTPHEELNTVEVLDPSANTVSTLPQGTKFLLLSNPIASSADFQFDALKEPTVFELFDLLGRSLLRQQLSAGQAALHLDMQKYPSGIYFARLGGETIRFVKM